MLINGIKFACNTCVKGHRSSSCNHIERPLVEIRKKGRPVTQCLLCRDLRKTKQVHVKCACTDKSETSSHQKSCCLDCSSLAEDYIFDGVAQGTHLVDSIASSSSIRCTCHEITHKHVRNHGISKDNSTQQIMMKIPDGSHIVLPGKAKQSHQRMTLDQQQADFPRRPKGLKSPSRRRSFPMRNTNSIARSEYAYNLTNSLPANMKAMMRIDDAALDMTSLPESTLLMEMQSFLLSNSFPMTKDADHNMNSALSVSSTSTSTSTSTSSTSSPNIPSCAAQNYVNESSTTRSDVDANSLNNLANHVLDIKEEPFYNMEDHMYPYANLDMARSATSSTNSSSSTYRSPYIQQSQWMCGSMIPHQSCPPIHLQTLGESVMVTITPLMSNDSPNIIQPSLDKPASTRILTCYFGSNCICPECMVHPSL